MARELAPVVGANLLAAAGHRDFIMRANASGDVSVVAAVTRITYLRGNKP